MPAIYCDTVSEGGRASPEPYKVQDSHAPPAVHGVGVIDRNISPSPYPAWGEGSIIDSEVNPVRNSSGALNPALRGGTPYGAEPGIILKSNPAA
jgi:hypothetical protein